ncbi:MAG: DUF3422 family protein [Pseudomonadota bacterium]
MTESQSASLDTQRWFTNRRPTLKISSPCLIRHFVLRPFENNDVVVLAESELRRIAEIQLVNALDAFVEKRTDSDQLLGRKEQDRFKSHIIQCVSNDDQRIPFEITVDIHTEFVTIEIRAYPSQSDTDSPSDVLQKTQQILEQLRYETGGVSTLSKSDSETLYDDFWETCTKFGILETEKFFRRDAEKNLLVDYSSLEQKKPLSKSEKEIARAQLAKLQIKAVFNGLIISTRRGAAPKGESRKHPSAIYHSSIKDIYTSSDASTLSQRYADFHDTALTDNLNYLNAHSGFFMPTLGFDEESEKEKDIHSSSTVLCGVLDGLGIYGCSFSLTTTLDGEKAKSDAYACTKIDPESSWSEVRFFVVYAGPSFNQLARLVRRLLYCGQNRVFMSPDFVQFQKTAQKMRALGRRVDHETIGNFTEDDLRKIRREIEKYNKQVRGGIEYRVNRTDFYWQNLKRRILNLRTVRILGWQTYDEYVSRIYGPHIAGYIEADDLRKELELKIARAEESLETRNSIELNKVLVEQATITAEQTDNMAEQTDSMAKQTRTTARLTSIAAIGVLFTLALRIFDFRPAFDSSWSKRATAEFAVIAGAVGLILYFLFRDQIKDWIRERRPSDKDK